MSQKNIEDPYKRALNHVLTQVLPKLKEKFHHESGRKVKSIKFIHDESKKGEEQFQSVAIFGTIITEFESKSTEHKLAQIDNSSVIIKMQIGDEHNMKFNNGGIQFMNEISLYADFLPYFSTVISDIQDVFPKLIYGFVPETDNRFEDIVILEDLSTEGYRLATSRTKLSLEHILLALKSLGKFHAASYIIKSIDKENFMQKVRNLKNVRNWVTDPLDYFQDLLAKNGERGLKYLETIPEYKGKLDSVRHFLKNICESLIRIFETNETSVLCHGDLCRNNMFFKYDDTNTETPIGVKLFDMATVLYASPVIDIAFFLYLNTDQAQRVQHWNTMIRTYYESLKATCASYSQDARVNIVVPTYEEILDEFKVKSMMGYLSCSFFLPVMMQKQKEDRSIWGKMTHEELIQHRLRTAGEEGTKAVGEILMHVIDSGFM